MNDEVAIATAIREDSANEQQGRAVRHILGPVQDDWEAAEVWLRAVRSKSRSHSAQAATNTEAIYRHHLAKLRWYVENVVRVTPSNWTMREVDQFAEFLENVPLDAMSPRGTSADSPAWRPFKTQPSPSSQADIKRFVHSLFNGWHKAGYIAINPMALHGAGASRAVNASRALNPDLLHLVFASMDRGVPHTFTERQSLIRDRFIFEALIGLGLRVSEFVGARMNAFYPLSVPGTGRTYWVFGVTRETGKGGKARRIPVTKSVWDAFTTYRQAFGLPAVPDANDATRVILSTRTKAVIVHGKTITHSGSRRFFTAWREITSRQGLYRIVTDRLDHTADELEQSGRADDAQQLRAASPHWLRHAFAKGGLLAGRSMRTVAGALGHSSMDTTMIYTEQEAVDLITEWERASPGSLAEMPARGEG